MMTYKQLSQSERDMLGLLKTQGKSLQEIVRYLSRSASSLSREMRRNSAYDLAVDTTYHFR